MPNLKVVMGLRLSSFAIHHAVFAVVGRNLGTALQFLEKIEVSSCLEVIWNNKSWCAAITIGAERRKSSQPGDFFVLIRFFGFCGNQIVAYTSLEGFAGTKIGAFCLGRALREPKNALKVFSTFRGKVNFLFEKK